MVVQIAALFFGNDNLATMVVNNTGRPIYSAIVVAQIVVTRQLFVGAVLSRFHITLLAK